MSAFATTLALRAVYLLDQAEMRGLDREELLAAAELAELDWSDPDVRIPVIRYWRLWACIAERLDDPDLGIDFGAEIDQPRSLVGFLVASSPTLLEGLQRFARYVTIVSHTLPHTLTREGDQWTLEAIRPLLVPGQREPVDEALAAIVAGCRELTGQPIRPVVVRFPYPRPQDISRHRSHFEANDLQFGAHRAAIVLRDRDVRHPMLQADQNLRHYLEELAGSRLQILQGDSVVDQAKRVILAHLSDGQPSVEEVAAEMALGRRSLQRRLREKETSFREVVEDVRKEMSVALLDNRDFAVYQVAYHLGYAEPSTFYRAFRRWYNVSPEEYRGGR